MSKKINSLLGFSFAFKWPFGLSLGPESLLPRIKLKNQPRLKFPNPWIVVWQENHHQIDKIPKYIWNSRRLDQRNIRLYFHRKTEQASLDYPVMYLKHNLWHKMIGHINNTILCDPYDMSRIIINLLLTGVAKQSCFIRFVMCTGNIEFYSRSVFSLCWRECWRPAVRIDSENNH